MLDSIKINNDCNNFKQLLKNKEYESCLNLANKVGREACEIILTTHGEEAHLSLLRLKEAVLVTLECIVKVRCMNCYITYVEKTLDLIEKLKDNEAIEIELRQKCGAFINLLMDSEYIRSIKHHLPHLMTSKKGHHLILVH